jgi:hypothetical protein
MPIDGHSCGWPFGQNCLNLRIQVRQELRGSAQCVHILKPARLYECAKIYGTDLEKRTSDLHEAQSALQRLQSGRPV